MLVLLGLLVFVYTLGGGLYAANGVEPLPTWDFLYQTAFLSAVVWGLKADARRSAVQSVYCSGLMVSIGWWIIIPYHLLKTRGARGLLPLLALVGCFFAALILATVLQITLYLKLLAFDPPR